MGPFHTSAIPKIMELDAGCTGPFQIWDPLNLLGVNSQNSEIGWALTVVVGNTKS